MKKYEVYSVDCYDIITKKAQVVCKLHKLEGARILGTGWYRNVLLDQTLCTGSFGNQNLKRIIEMDVDVAKTQSRSRILRCSMDNLPFRHLLSPFDRYYALHFTSSYQSSNT